MKTRKHFTFLMIATLGGFWVLTSPVYGGSLKVSDEEAIAPSEGTPVGQRIGAPQVLEIPPLQEEDVTSGDAPAATPMPSAREEVYVDPVTEVPSLSQTAALGQMVGRRNYLGVLYATVEDGPSGVKVLDVVPGSPADRAGFHGANRPPENHSMWIKVAIVAVAMAPLVGPAAIPLAIAHDMYMGRQTPGDVIVAVGDRSVRTAQEFSEVMRHYQPLETVAFSLLRNGKRMQISVQLEEEPG